MIRRRLPVLVSLVLVVTLGSAQLVLRGGAVPPPEELVRWQPFAELGEPPYDGPVLLEFSADWCMPCRRLQVTVFRDPGFVGLLDRLGLRPVRLEYDAADALEFQRLQRQYGVGGLPAMVVVAPDGRHAPAIEGARTTGRYEEELSKAMSALENRLFWNDPDFTPEANRDRLVFRHFASWWYLDRRQRTDWRYNPASEFAGWIRDWVDLVGDQFTNHPHGYAYYQRHRVRTVPTLIVEDWRGIEIARFEGLSAIERAPGEIARLARERRLGIPEPPRPYAKGGD